MNAYEQIRAALEHWQEWAGSEQDAHIAANALGALAELEKAASVPVAWRWERNREHGWVEHMSRYKQEPTPYIRYITPLYAAPPAIAAAPPVQAVEVTEEMIERVFQRAAWDFADGSTRVTYKLLRAWQAELGPALGLAVWREPREEECKRINWFTHNTLDALAETQEVRPEAIGRAMFNAVREVMGGRK